jgi:hypothetical protein
MSRTFEVEGFKVLWGTIVREEQFDMSSFPAIPNGQSEPVGSIKELKPLVDQIIEWGKDFTPKQEISPVVASSWISAFDPKSTGMNIHTDEDHGGTISAVIWFEGEEDQGGDLVLWDPRWENPKLWGGVKGDGKHTIKFKPGTVVMFPSSVWHGVTAYTGSTQRRSLNLVLTFRNVKQIALEDICTTQLAELGNQLGYKYDSSLESLLGLISLLKTKI